MGKVLLKFILENLGESVMMDLLNAESPSKETLDERLGRELVARIPDNHIQKSILDVDIKEAKENGFFEEETEESKELFESQGAYIIAFTDKGKEEVYPLIIEMAKDKLQASLDMLNKIEV